MNGEGRAVRSSTTVENVGESRSEDELTFLVYDSSKARWKGKRGSK